jgi:hypothetical protein
MNPERVRICTYYAGEAIGALVKVMQRDDISPNTRMKAAKEVLNRVSRALPGVEAREVYNNVFQTVHERQTDRALRRAHFARRRAEKRVRRQQETGGGCPTAG